MSDVAVIVLDVDGGEMLRACLDSIAAQTLPAAQVVVWDNSETNLGFAGGNNEAWKQTTAPFVVWMSTSTRPPSGVQWSAFESRFVITWSTRSPSVRIVGGSPSSTSSYSISRRTVLASVS